MLSQSFSLARAVETTLSILNIAYFANHETPLHSSANNTKANRMNEFYLKKIQARVSHMNTCLGS